MATVQRANVVLTVPDEEVERYLSKGYSQVDKGGKIIKLASLKTYDALNAEYLRLKDEFDKLKEDYQKLVDEMQVFKDVAEQSETTSIKRNRKSKDE